MKKFSKILSLLMAVLMIAAIQLPAMAVELGDEVTTNIPALGNLTKANCTALGTSTQTLNTSQMMVENDKYIFVAIGMKAKQFRYCSAIQIFDKATGNLLTTITQTSTNGTYYCPIRNMHVIDDVLYVSWGNSIKDDLASVYVAKDGSTTYKSPVKAYDVSNVAEGSTSAQLVIESGNTNTVADIPYTLGGISYLDEESGILYTSRVASKASNIRYYRFFETSGMSSAITSATAPTPKKFFTSNSGKSMNAVQFIVKDGWLFEVLQNKAGLSEFDKCTDTTFVGNNAVYVYDLRGVTFTTEDQNVSSYLKGIYTTATAGDAVIRDIEIVGDYMYLATSAGIEVVSLAPAKAADASASTVLTAAKTITETGNAAGAADLDAIGNSLFAAYAGSTYYGALVNNAASAGALVVYDITTPANPTRTAGKSVNDGLREISVNAVDKKIYALKDVYATPRMTAFSYTPDAVVEEEFEFKAIKLGDSTTVVAGTCDISVELSNPDAATGTLICAVYEGNKLANVFVKADYSGNGAVTMAEDYTVSGAVTEVKAMFLNSLTGELKPLIPAISIGK